MSLQRTILLLDHSPLARQKPCFVPSEGNNGLESDDDDEIDIEPCSMWTSFMNAALHFSRITLDLTPAAQIPQYSVHVAAGDRQTGGSVILNTWASKEQNMSEINAQLQLLRQEDKEVSEDEPTVPDTWFEQALKEAIAHIVEPPQEQTGSALKQLGAGKKFDEVYNIPGAPQPTTTPATTMIQPRSTCKVVFVIVDPETFLHGGSQEVGDAEMTGEEEKGWFYGDQDIRGILYEATRSMEASIKKRNTSIHLDLIRIATSQSQARGDIIAEQISRICTASVYTVIAKDELSPLRALTNYFLLQNKDVKVLRIRDMPFSGKFSDQIAELFHRSDHIGPTAVRKTNTEDTVTSILQENPPAIENAIEADYGRVNAITRAKSSRIHTLVEKDSTDDVVTWAVVNHGGRLFVHCMSTEYESGMPKRATELQPLPPKGRLSKDERSKREDSVMMDDASSTTGSTVSDVVKHHFHNRTVTPIVQDFIKNIVRINAVKPGGEWNGGSFIEVTPPALKTTAALQFKTSGGGGGVKSHARKDQATVGVDMAVVHSTSKIDLETRWLVQWQGERVHPIAPEHSVLLEQFRQVICKPCISHPDTITTVIEKLITDARPAVLPGPINHPDNLPPTQIKIIQQALQTYQQTQQHQDQALRESAQAILADLWLVAQRFKSVSRSHANAARQIGEMISPTGLDYNTVKMTYVAPVLRAFLNAKEVDPSLGVVNLPDGSSPNPNQGQGMNSNAWGGRGGGNVGGGNRGGRGGMQGGGARFSDNNNRNNNANNSNNRRGGFGGNAGGPGGFRNSQGGNANNVTNSTEEILSDPTLPLFSMTGKTQPVPYLETTPPTREEIEGEDQVYLSELGEEGSLLRTYWGPRGAQGSSVAAIVNSVTSLDSTSLLEASPSVGGVPPVPIAAGVAPVLAGADLASIHAAAQQKRLKRPRLQDFSGRTPVKEYGGFSKSSGFS
ncbi:hypothetical protein EC957_007137 [Mortierella hygrophila]|uniref:Uncharacterized protein n=1 Tax=Mortierella hygrophila TaxID=979708 RepID=A0A9P6K649_9FUNG|nr:hypothetical protein EC957_007137 [Mortierella hygrophila]